MSFDTAPLYSRNRINNAGNNVRRGLATQDDIAVIENWRASHAHILNTFQASLRTRSRGKDITVAQRLKRRNTIFDKLSREREMNLSHMNDVAGCRIIFADQKELHQFRKEFHSARFKHILRTGDDRYNYINNPKKSGYRGVHDVYQYRGTTAQGSRWDNLLLEIQYRTTYQHSWATAVEVADFIDTTRIKFGDADQAHQKFFQLSSELIAREFEGQTSCCPELTNADLVNDFKLVDRRIGLLRTFRGLRKKEKEVRSTENAILIIHCDSQGEMKELEIETFPSMSAAISRYEKLEREYEKTGSDIVLVRAGNTESIREAFRNYFSDVVDFVHLVDESCRELPRKRRTLISRV